MHVAAVAERRELRRERRNGDFPKSLGRPSALPVHHTDRAHMAIEGQLPGTLMEDLAVDVVCLLRSEKDAERRDRVGAAAAQPLLTKRRGCRVLWRRNR